MVLDLLVAGPVRVLHVEAVEGLLIVLVGFLNVIVPLRDLLAALLLAFVLVLLGVVLDNSLILLWISAVSALVLVVLQLRAEVLRLR